MAKSSAKLRAKLALPATFTLDACRHGGMTELEEAELTDGKAAPCLRIAAELMKDMPSGPWSGRWRRHGSAMLTRLANDTAGTEFRNEPRFGFRNDDDRRRRGHCLTDCRLLIN